MRVKIQEAKSAAELTPVTEPAAEPATQPVIEPATEPAIEPAIEPAAESATSINEAWAVYKKHKQDNWTSTAEEKKKKKKYEQFLKNFLNQYCRHSDL